MSSNQVLNSDVLIQIMVNLETEDVFRLSRVSKQFKDCSLCAISNAKQLVIGKQEIYCSERRHSTYSEKLEVIDYSHRFKTTEDLSKDRRFKPFLVKCPLIRCVQLNGYAIDTNILLILTQNLRQLVCLSLKSCKFLHSNNGTQFLSFPFKYLSISKLDYSTFDYHINQTQIGISFDFIANLRSLAKFTLCSQSLEHRLDVEEYVRLILARLPSSIKWLSLKRQQWLEFTNLENVLNLDHLKNLKHLFIETYAISRQFLSIINQKLNLVSLGVQCHVIDWNIVREISISQKRLKHLRIWWSNILGSVDSSGKIESLEPFERVVVLSLNDMLFLSSIREHQYFMKLFPNLKTLQHSYSGVVCKARNRVFSNKCETCHRLTLNSVLKQITSLKKLVIGEEEIQSVMDFLYSDHNNLTKLFIALMPSDKTEDVIKEIESRIEETILAFVRLSNKYKERIFKIIIMRKMTLSSDLIIPKNLIVII